MEKFNSRVKVGDFVQIIGNPAVRKITEIHETRNWVKIKGLCGEFKRSSVVFKKSESTNCMYEYRADRFGKLRVVRVKKI